VEFTPVWFMRQAGRYLPGYREIRKDYGVLEAAKTPEICREITLMPIGELGVDAAVMFADIMLPLERMGIKFRIEENVGPIIENPIKNLEDVEALKEFDPLKHVPFVLEATRQVRAKLDQSGHALVGFAGAPFTVASYLIEGQPSREYAKTKRMMFGDREAWELLMSKLAAMTGEYLSAQIKAGADAVQLFDSWIGALSAKDYERYVAPFVQEIFKQVASEHPDTPAIHFGTNTYHLLSEMKDNGASVFSIDWRTPIKVARKVLGDSKAIQGNLEPAVLLACDREFIAKRTQEVLDDNDEAKGHIFNLGHGVPRETPVENARFVVDYVHDHTR
jgi:uroporphyrinogen decarboxylase